MALSDHDRFVSREWIARLSTSDSVRRAFQAVQARRAPGLLAETPCGNEYYADALELAQQLVARHQPVAWDRPLRNVIAAVAAWHRVSIVVDDTADTGLLHGQSVLRVTSQGTDVGLLLPETALTATRTGRLVWICENPSTPHDNDDPDHGSCGKCPFSLKSVARRA